MPSMSYVCYMTPRPAHIVPQPEARHGATPALTAIQPLAAGHRDRPGSRARAGCGPAHEPTALRNLVTERHWQKFTTFERQFRKAARELAELQDEPELAKVTVSARQFERWYAGKVKTRPHPDACRILEFMFDLPVARLLAPAGAPDHGKAHVPGSEDAAVLTEWLTASSVSDEAIAGLDRAAVRVAESHAATVPAVVLASAWQVQGTVQGLLRSQRARHRQQRELLRINGNLLAHISLLLSDLGDNGGGDEYGNTALLYLREAGASEACAWYVLAKAARWRHEYTRAADLARHGLGQACSDAMRVQLACYEANTAALAGDGLRAADAMRLAEDTAAAMVSGQATLSPWSFPPERMTIFRISVALAMDNPSRALASAAGWNPDPVPGRPCVTAAWAQIRIGAAIARLGQDALDGIAGEIAPVLALAPQFRIATVTGWLDDLGQRLSAGRYAGSPVTASLQQQIRCFTSENARHRKRTPAPAC